MHYVAYHGPKKLGKTLIFEKHLDELMPVE
jgi:hypothetical protein